MKQKMLQLKSSLLLLTLCAIATMISFKASASCQSGFTWTQSADNIIAFTNTSTGTTVNTIYSWSFGDGNYNSTQNPVHTYNVPGTYQVCLHITDSLCNSYFCDSITVTGIVICNITLGCFQVTHASCGTCADGIAHSVATGGTAPYSYVWDTYPAQTTASATGLLPGAYTVCVTDANSCTACCTVTIDTVNCNLGAGCFEFAEASCDTCTDGSAHSFAIGGTAPFFYAWNTNPVQTTSSATGLTPGAYTVCITDFNGCTACCTVSISNGGCTMTAGCYEYAHASCDTCADGVGHSFPIGGTAPYSYEWDTYPVQNTATATGLYPGGYNVCITDAGGCTACCIVGIYADSCTMTAGCYEFAHASCPTCADGIAHSYPNGGTGPYSYEWNTNPVQTTAEATGLLPGPYTVCITDANGCTGCCTTTIDSAGCNMTAGCYEYAHASCPTCADGIAQSYPIGGTFPYTYEWNTNPVQTTSAATDLFPGTYTVCITDVNGCTACCTTTIDTGSCNMTAGCYQYALASCPTCADGIAHSYGSGGTAPYSYAWDTYPVQTTAAATGLLPGTYTVCITDDNGCTACCTVIIDYSNPNCYAYYYLYPDSLAAHTYWAVNASAGTPPLTYLWSWGDGTYDSIPYPSHLYADAGFYTICLYIHDSAGCTDSICNSYQLQKMSEAQGENTIVKVNVIADIATTVQNANVLQSWSVFPNPAQGSAFINYILTEPARVHIDLYDVLGKQVYMVVNAEEQAGEYNAFIDTRKLGGGMYILQIHAGDQVVSQKIAIIN